MPSISFAFDGKNEEAQRAARKVASTLVAGVEDSTKKGIRQLIVRAIADGIPPYDAARLIKPMIGLNSVQQIDALNYRTELINSGLSQSAVDRKVNRYIQKALRRRAQTIARTEIMESLNAGQEASWNQAQSKGLLGADAKKKWITTSFGACPICKALNGEVVGVKQYFQSIIGPVLRPVAHPNCRCAVVPVPGKGVPAGPVSAVGRAPLPVPENAIGYVARQGARVQRVKQAKPLPPEPSPTPKPGMTGPEIRKYVTSMEDIQTTNLERMAKGLREQLAKARKDLKSKVNRAIKEEGNRARFSINHEAVKKSRQHLGKIEEELKVIYRQVVNRESMHELILTNTRSEFRVLNMQGKSLPIDRYKAANLLERGSKPRISVPHLEAKRARLKPSDRDTEAIDWVRRLVGDKAGGRRVVKGKELDPWTVKMNNTGSDLVDGRANFNVVKNQLNMDLLSKNTRESRSIVVHEFGHFIEKHTNGWKASKKWVKSRIKPGEQRVQLKKVFPRAKYDANEWTYRDEFFDIYIGKEYNTGSEVLSMGLEYLYKDPIKLMKKDANMFDFLINTIRQIQKGGV